jgi:hypothetical protein
MAEIKFLEILNDLSPAFTSSLQNAAGRKVAEQIGRVIVPVQKIAGVPENFSVMSFPYPRLTPEDLKDMLLIEDESYIFNIGEAEFKIDVDHFGQINWIHIREAPNIYEALKIQLSRVAESADYTEFWRH